MKTTDVYFKYPAGSVIDAPTIEDESCGLFPCFKAVVDGKSPIVLFDDLLVLLNGTDHLLTFEADHHGAREVNH